MQRIKQYNFQAAYPIFVFAKTAGEYFRTCKEFVPINWPGGLKRMDPDKEEEFHLLAGIPMENVINAPEDVIIRFTR